MSTHPQPLPISALDRMLANVCASCPACRHARTTQQGVVFNFVNRIENKICPFCRAYARVHGRKPHEPLPRLAC